MTQPHCLDCGGELRIVGAGYDGIKITCNCSEFGRSIYVDWKSFHDAPRPWVYEGVGPGTSELDHIGDYRGRPDPDIYD